MSIEEAARLAYQHWDLLRDIILFVSYSYIGVCLFALRWMMEFDE